MIEEQYVSFETAKLLKEKGVDASDIDAYFPFVYYADGKMDFYDDDNPIFVCEAVTQQMAMRWLREVYGLFISIGNDDLNYNWQILDVKNRTNDFDPTCLTESYAGYESYEEACEAAIKCCLEHLLK